MARIQLSVEEFLKKFDIEIYKVSNRKEAEKYLEICDLDYYLYYRESDFCKKSLVNDARAEFEGILNQKNNEELIIIHTLKTLYPIVIKRSIYGDDVRAYLDSISACLKGLTGVNVTIDSL